MEWDFSGDSNHFAVLTIIKSNLFLILSRLDDIRELQCNNVDAFRSLLTNFYTNRTFLFRAFLVI